MTEEMKTDSKDEFMDIETKFKNMKSVDDLDLNLENLVRGKTPEDIEVKCLKLCKDYLSGNWSQQTTETIEVRRITGGLMNQIYFCGIRSPDPSAGVPQEVAVRLYGKNIFDKDKERIRDLVISLIFSEKKIGPQLYGIFEEGQIQKYYKHRQFKGEDQKNPELVRKVYQTLAQVHSLEMPLKKEGDGYIKIMNEYYDQAIEKHPISQFIDEFNCETLKKYDLKTEIDWIKGVIEKVNSPVVFTHNDFRSSNLLITEPNDELVVCDYDLSGYGYRGSDFAATMREWGRKQFEMKSVEGIPLDSQFKPMIEIYVEECQRIYGKSYSENEINSVDHILKEAKIFLLFGFIFFTVMMMRGNRDENNNKEENKEEPPNYKLMMEFAELNYKNYHLIKDKLSAQNIFD